MNFLKNNIRTIIGFIIGVLIASGITVYATSYLAKDISYTIEGTNIKNVEEALNNLYSINKNTKEITLRGNSYNKTGDAVCCGVSANSGIKKITIKNISYSNSSFNIGWLKIGDEPERSFNSISVGDCFEINNNNFYISFYANSTTKYGGLLIDLIIE